MSSWKIFTLLSVTSAAIAQLALSAPTFAMSGDGCSGDCASCHSITLQEANGLLKEIGEVKAVRPAPVRGLYEVTIEQQGKTGLAYLDYGKKHIIAGQVFNIASREAVVASAGAPPQPQPQQDRLDPATLKSEQSLVMGNPKGKKKLFVFTDPECPFCSKAHAELKKLVRMEPDLAIYIKLYPLKMHPKAYDKARVILSENSLELLEDSFAGKALRAPQDKDSKKPVDDTISFAQSVGIGATPTLVLPDGRILPGYKDAAAMRKLLSGTE